ncbi:amidohydrolase family protein [Halobacteria archaeon AArc-curdl1]|uniref:Amidohydrolase family protein n=1 Tax=Natronosalvus hydrolyticus TaxID=2979988 RepID=A0AAP3E563_9EURY|nr:amidohydrolase family protein [Halobacteria archaeon AArc-curdl1]
MIDCHFHVWTQDVSTAAARADRAEQFREEASVLGIDRTTLIGELGDTVDACRENNRTIAAFVEEHPDLFYGWARAHPEWGDDAVAEFKRAVTEDGLVGLKHHFLGTEINITDTEFAPLAEAAVELDVPIIAHVMQNEEPYPTERPSEARSEDVASLASRYPDLKLISGHISAGGNWEHRIKRIADHENVYLDLSGSNCEVGQIEMAADVLGVDRLLFGTDTWLSVCAGKLDGADLPASDKAQIAYNFENLLHEGVENRLSLVEREERIDAARERFEAFDRPREETIVDVNAYVGRWPFHPFDASSEGLLEVMDRKGVDKAIVSSLGSVFYRDPQHGNRELVRDIDGHEDRLLPFTTINPTFPGWEDDLRHCVEEWGMHGVRLLPAYHDYEINAPEAKDLLRACADLEVPAMLVAALEDQRGRHPRVELRHFEGIGQSRMWRQDEGKIDDVIDLLLEVPETDVIVADTWTGGYRIIKETTTVNRRDVRLQNKVRTGQTFVVIDDLFCYWTQMQGRQIVDGIGVDHLVMGPQLPFMTFESTYNYTKHLPASEAEKDRVRSGNVIELLDL